MPYLNIGIVIATAYQDKPYKTCVCIFHFVNHKNVVYCDNIDFLTIDTKIVMCLHENFALLLM